MRYENHVLLRRPLLLTALLVGGFALLMVRVALLVGAADAWREAAAVVDAAPIPCDLLEEEDEADADSDLDVTDEALDASELSAIEGIEESDVTDEADDVAGDEDQSLLDADDGAFKH